MSLSTRALCSVDDVLSFVTLSTPTSGDRERIEFFINTVTNLIENYCNQYFSTFTHEESLHGSGTKVLVPSQWPIQSVNTINVDSEYVFDTSTEVPSGDYKIANDHAVINTQSIWQRGNYNILISYEVGFDSIPDDVRFACAAEVANIWKNRKDLNGLSMTHSGDTIQVSEKTFMSKTQRILDRYKVTRYL